jgi:hypothetical protein
LHKVLLQIYTETRS